MPAPLRALLGLVAEERKDSPIYLLLPQLKAQPASVLVQAPPSVANFLLNENMMKMFFGIYMIMVFDPQILFNDGFYDLMEVRIPAGSLLKPLKPAALSSAIAA